MVHVEGDIVIDRPIVEVFDAVADERNEPDYNANMVEVEQLTPGPLGVGTRFRAESSMRGRIVPMTIEFTEYARPRRLASRTTLATMDISGTLTFDPDPGGTRLRWSWDVEPKGLLRAAGPVIAWMGRRQEKAIWTGLKTYLEAGRDPQ
jgi:polyketide cyclase/dehydrase/lipid transport protein